MSKKKAEHQNVRYNTCVLESRCLITYGWLSKLTAPQHAIACNVNATLHRAKCVFDWSSALNLYIALKQPLSKWLCCQRIRLEILVPKSNSECTWPKLKTVFERMHIFRYNCIQLFKLISEISMHMNLSLAIISTF